MSRSVPSARRAVLTAVFAACAVSVVGCGGGRSAALATQDPTRSPSGAVEVVVECATDVTVEVEPGAGVDGLPLVTAVGTPVAGRCTVPLVLVLPERTRSYQDAATGMVVDIPSGSEAR